MVARVWPEARPKAKCTQTVAVNSSLRTTYHETSPHGWEYHVGLFEESDKEHFAPFLSQRVGQEILLIWDRTHHQKACWRSPKPSVLVLWSVVCLILGSK